MTFPMWLWIGMLAAADPCAAESSMCTCVPPGPPRQAFEQADAVFRGVVLDVSTRRNRSGPRWLLPTRVRVRVTERWKGVGADRVVVVRTGTGGGDCGYRFVPGGEYVIYAWANEDSGLMTGICTRTSQVEHAGEDLRELRALAPAAEPE